MGNKITPPGHHFPSTPRGQGGPVPAKASVPPTSLPFPPSWILAGGRVGAGVEGSTLPWDVTFTSITSGPICSVPPHPQPRQLIPTKPSAGPGMTSRPARPTLRQACSEGPRRDSERLSLSPSAPLIGFPARRGQQKRRGEETQREGASTDKGRHSSPATKPAA